MIDRELLEATSKLTNELVGLIEDIGPCDHAVGICCCGLNSLVDRAREIIEDRLSKLNPKIQAEFVGLQEWHDGEVFILVNIPVETEDGKGKTTVIYNPRIHELDPFGQYVVIILEGE